MQSQETRTQQETLMVPDFKLYPKATVINYGGGDIRTDWYMSGREQKIKKPPRGSRWGSACLQSQHLEHGGRVTASLRPSWAVY